MWVYSAADVQSVNELIQPATHKHTHGNTHTHSMEEVWPHQCVCVCFCLSELYMKADVCTNSLMTTKHTHSMLCYFMLHHRKDRSLIGWQLCVKMIHVCLDDFPSFYSCLSWDSLSCYLVISLAQTGHFDHSEPNGSQMSCFVWVCAYRRSFNVGQDALRTHKMCLGCIHTCTESCPLVIESARCK